MPHIHWRLYRPEDAAAVALLHIEQETALGRRLDLPNLMSQPVLIALVGETNGEITHGMFLEAEAEICVLGVNPLPPEEVAPAEAMMLDVLHCYGIRIVRAFIPHVALKVEDGQRRASPLARILMRLGFTREGSELCAFYRWIRGGTYP